MAANCTQTDKTAHRQWAIVERWQEYEGERRANLLRVLGIAGFYLIELVNRYGLKFGLLEMPKVAAVDRQFHLAMTALAGAWAVSGWGVLSLLRRQVFPPALKFLSTGMDAVFLTVILAVADGPRSPLLAAYFLLIGLGALRFSVPLVRFSTLACMGGYAFLLGNAVCFRPALRVPRYHQMIFLLALALAGILAAQVIRRSREAAQDYAARVGGSS